MKKFKKELGLLALMFCFVFNVNAQDKENPWAIGIGTNMVDAANHGWSTLGDQTKDYFGTKDWNVLPVLSRIYVARYLDKGFSLDFAGSINNISKAAVGDVTDETYYALDLGVRYDLNHLFGETGWFDPYVKLGLGGGWVSDDMFGAISPSLGFNTWFNDKVGLNFETSYKNGEVFGSSNLKEAQYVGFQHFQHSVSLVLRFGSTDTDGDGVNDKKDLCPEIPGKVELMGCPDSDDDGIADKDDQCPNVAGTLNGCPDSDNDGVIDSKDKCPNKAGEFKGCPDSDNDGLADFKDNCPNVSGPKANDGCPWGDADNDGVKDNLDKCVNVKGPATNGGCPVKVVKLSEEAKAKLGRYAKTIQFNSARSDFKPGVSQTLDAIAKVMKEFKDVSFDVEGHSDSAGNDAKNLTLSQRRAQAVVDYLATHGISGSRLHAVGYGEAQPIATNKTRAGRALNRRVVLKAIEK